MLKKEIVSLLEEKKTRFEQLADEIQELTTSLLQTVGAIELELPANERSAMGTINEKNKLLILKAVDYYRSSPQLAVSEVDWKLFLESVDDRHLVEGVLFQTEAISKQLLSLKILLDFYLYQSVLVDYKHAQYKAGNGEAGYLEKIEEYKQFFPASKKRYKKK